MTSKRAIVKWYPQADMQSFFQEKLGIPNAPKHTLVSDLRALVNSYVGQELPPTIRDRIINMLDELSSATNPALEPASTLPAGKTRARTLHQSL
jgi:hypothetical protein